MTNSIDDITTQAKSYLIIGSNTTEQHPVIGMRLRQAAKKGAKLIVADPRDTRIADEEIEPPELTHNPFDDAVVRRQIGNIAFEKDPAPPGVGRCRRQRA